MYAFYLVGVVLSTCIRLPSACLGPCCLTEFVFKSGERLCEIVGFCVGLLSVLVCVRRLCESM